MLCLEKPPAERTEEDDLATCKVLMEENIFPEFHNDLNVLKIFAKNLAIKHLQTGQHLLYPNTKDDNLYKVIKGETAFKRVRDGTWNVKGKG
jgi:CRP-like cAMP-binding protein